jgi:hypothetical protein
MGKAVKVGHSRKKGKRLPTLEWNWNSLLEDFFRQLIFFLVNKIDIVPDFGFLLQNAFFFYCTNIRYIQKQLV